MVAPCQRPGTEINDPNLPLRLAFGSCRVSLADTNSHGIDALAAYACTLARDAGDTTERTTDDAAAGGWPSVLLLVGDQVYAASGVRAVDFGRRVRYWLCLPAARRVGCVGGWDRACRGDGGLCAGGGERSWAGVSSICVPT
jgi:hypothetical protein